MNEKTAPITTPPGIISSIISGFNSIAGNIQLILFPLLFDLLLWFGPHFRIKTIVQPLIEETNAAMAAISQAEVEEILEATREFWQVLFDHFNMVSTLSTFPVGIPSLMVSSLPIVTPLGNPPFYELTSFTSVLLLWIGFSLVGFILGSWYFSAIAGISAADRNKPTIGDIGATALQTLLLSIILIFIALVLFVPFSMILSVFTLISPLLAQISMLVMGLVIIWLLVPFGFSPHGIFTNQLSAVKSILVSLRLVRRFLPGTGLFLLILLLLSEGLNTLWQYAPESSWMALVGILGHAFISTAVISASFFYYRAGIKWMQEIINRTVSDGIKV